jgi:hypothetical protein
MPGWALIPSAADRGERLGHIVELLAEAYRGF